MSRPDLQAGFNGWQAIDPTPPPQFWQNNSGGGLRNISKLPFHSDVYSNLFSFIRSKEPRTMGC